jgi:hypothetical protein
MLSFFGRDGFEQLTDFFGITADGFGYFGIIGFGDIALE